MSSRRYYLDDDGVICDRNRGPAGENTDVHEAEIVWLLNSGAEELVRLRDRINERERRIDELEAYNQQNDNLE